MIINQVHSIGDILFCEPIFRHFWTRDGVKPIVPVRDHLMYLTDYIDSAKFVPESIARKVMDLDSLVPTADYLPLRWANQIIRGYDPNDHHDFKNMMLDKYRLAGLDPMLWKTLKINFNHKKSDNLFKLLVKKVSPIVVNRNSSAGPNGDYVSTGTEVFMAELPGYNVLDWAGIIWASKENHHVSTCTFFIFQALINQGWNQSQIFLYQRPNIDGLRGISQLQPDFDFTAVLPMDAISKNRLEELTSGSFVGFGENRDGKILLNKQELFMLYNL